MYSKRLPSSYRLYKQPLTCKSTQPFGKKSLPSISNTFKLAINTQSPSTQKLPFNIKHVLFFPKQKTQKHTNKKNTTTTELAQTQSQQNLIGFSAHGQDDDVTTHGQAFQGRSQRLQGSLMPPSGKRANGLGGKRAMEVKPSNFRGKPPIHMGYMLLFQPLHY